MTIDLPTLHGQTILIVDGVSLSAAELSNRLSALGAKVHVAANAVCAARFAESKRFDMALIGSSCFENNRVLVKALERRGIPYVTCATSSRLKNSDYSRVFSLRLESAA